MVCNSTVVSSVVALDLHICHSAIFGAIITVHIYTVDCIFPIFGVYLIPVFNGKFFKRLIAIAPFLAYLNPSFSVRRRGSGDSSSKGRRLGRLPFDSLARFAPPLKTRPAALGSRFVIIDRYSELKVPGSAERACHKISSIISSPLYPFLISSPRRSRISASAPLSAAPRPRRRRGLR